MIGLYRIFLYENFKKTRIFYTGLCNITIQLKWN